MQLCSICLSHLVVVLCISLAFAQLTKLYLVLVNTTIKLQAHSPALYCADSLGLPRSLIQPLHDSEIWEERSPGPLALVCLLQDIFITR